MNKKLSLNRTQLKIIAIISMVIDHTAWGFLDFYTPLAQFLHVLGRFTVPIMCFFIAEGFRKTKDLKRYIHRMITFAAISVIPFYMFFHEEYGYRQNIIFDLLLGLLLLTVLESNLAKWKKVMLTILLFAISMTIGGWVIEPMLFILIFYYGKDFKQKVKLFVIADVGMVASLVILISLNSVYHFSQYNWVWWDKFYLLGFMLALPLLNCYNGEKGPDIIGKYFFYVFYPAHFVILVGIKQIVAGNISSYDVYATAHILCLLMAVLLTALTFTARPSRGQNVISFFLLSASVYVFGFVLEIFARTADGYYIACNVQYIGELTAMIAAVSFVSYVCQYKIPNFVYAIHVIIASWLMFKLLLTRENLFFYTNIGINTDGPFPRPDIDHSTGFFLAIGFIFFMCLEILYMCMKVIRTGSKLEKKRVRLILWSVVVSWLPFVLTILGLTGGYEIPAIGLAIAGLLLYLTFIKYGTIDSVTLASESALDRGREGILVIDNRYHIQYHNHIVDDLLGEFPHNKDVRKWGNMGEVLSGECTKLVVEDRIYEYQVEPLLEKGYEQGKMIWIIDSTKHHEAMKKIQEFANRDGLTGLLNRTKFKELVDEDVQNGCIGSFLMMDMDNFKAVNDHYGHQRGDTVLKSLAEILLSYSEDRMWSCRVGGDEFCAYLRNVVDKEEITQIAESIMKRFSTTFREDDEFKCTISMGIVINDKEGGLLDCSKMYSTADKKLYDAKSAGKNTFIL